jgi:hypothetical protein
MSERDDAPADEFETRGPGHKRAGHPRLSSHTPVRFDPVTITAIRQFSDEDGVTVSAWVRRVVRREIERRVSLRMRTASAHAGGQVIQFDRLTRTTTAVGGQVQAEWAIASMG